MADAKKPRRKLKPPSPGASGRQTDSEEQWNYIGEDRETKTIVVQTGNMSINVRWLMRVEREPHEFEKRNQEKGRQYHSQSTGKDKVLHLREASHAEDEVNGAKYQNQKGALGHAAHHAEEGHCSQYQYVSGTLLA